MLSLISLSTSTGKNRFNPFKSITIRGIIKTIIIATVIFVCKVSVYPILKEYMLNYLLELHIIFSILIFLTANIFNESFDYITKDINIDSLKKINLFDPNKDITNSMKSGESSKTGESSKSGRVITDSDYESDSSTKDKHPYVNQADYENQEANVSKLVNSNLPAFKETLKSLSNEEIIETMNVIDYMKEEYYKSKVPSAKVQIENLNVKEGICANQLEQNLAEGDKPKGKGKEIEDTRNK